MSQNTETLFDRINKELRAEKKRADDKTEDELKALEKLNASDPEILLDGYIKSVVDKELQHAGVMANDDPVNRAPQGNTTATKVVEAMQSQKKPACPLAEARGKERALRPSKNKGKGKGKKTGRGKSKNKSTKSSARTKKRPQAKAWARSPTRVESWCEHGLTQGAPCSTAL